MREDNCRSRSEPPQRTDESAEKFKRRHQDWVQRSDALCNFAEVIIAKHRRGPIDTIALHFDPQFTRFSDLTQRPCVT